MKATKRISVIAAVLATLYSVPSLADNADIRFNIGDVSFGIDVGTPPPAPIIEYVPVARPGYVLSPGYWRWTGHRYVWNKGTWEKARSGYRHVSGHWQQRGKHWHFEPAHWELQKKTAHHDNRRDHDRLARYEDRHDMRSSHDRDGRRNHSW